MAVVDFGVEGDYDSADLADYGYLDPAVGFFAILIAFVQHGARRVLEMTNLLSSASTSNGVTPGTAGNVLTSTGAAWVSSAPMGAKIAESVLAVDTATITFSSLPTTYRHLRLILHARSTEAATMATVYARINADTTANYDVEYQISSAGTTTSFEVIGSTAMQIGSAPAASAGANLFSLIDTLFTSYRSNVQKMARSTVTQKIGTATGNISVRDYANVYRDTSPVLSITLLLPAGNFAAGTTATLYGIN